MRPLSHSDRALLRAHCGSVNRWRRAAAFLVLALVLACAAPHVAAQSGVQVPPETTPALDELVQQFENLTFFLETDFAVLGRQLYWILFAIELFMLGLNVVVRGPHTLTTSAMPNPISNLILLIVVGALGYVVVYTSTWWVAGGVLQEGWVYQIRELFERLGREAAQCPVEVPTPCPSFSDVWTGGSRLADALILNRAISDLSILWNFHYLGFAFLVSVLVALLFLGIVIQMTLTYVAFVLTTRVAPIFLACIAFRGTSGLASGYLSFLFYLGIKLLFLYLLGSIAGQLALGWADLVMEIDRETVSSRRLAIFKVLAYEVLGGVTLLAVLIIFFPGRIASMIAGRLDFDFRKILSPD